MEDHTAIYIYNSYYNIVIILVGFPINIDDRVRFYEPNSNCEQMHGPMWEQLLAIE